MASPYATWMKEVFSSRPLRVNHVNRRQEDNPAFLAEQAAKAMHLGNGSAGLLKFYMERSNGFTPSRKYIASMLHAGGSTIHRNRQALITAGIIGIDKASLILDWDRIRLFASLDPLLTKKPFVAKGVSRETSDLNKKGVSRETSDLNKRERMLKREIEQMDDETFRQYIAGEVKTGFQRYDAADWYMRRDVCIGVQRTFDPVSSEEFTAASPKSAEMDQDEAVPNDASIERADMTYFLDESEAGHIRAKMQQYLLDNELLPEPQEALAAVR